MIFLKPGLGSAGINIVVALQLFLIMDALAQGLGSWVGNRIAFKLSM